MKRFSQQLTVCCHLNVRPAVFQLSGVRICLHTNGEGRGKRKNSKNKPWNGTVQLKYKSPQAEKQDLVTKYLHLQFWVLATSHTLAAPLAQKDIYSPLFVGRHRKRSILGSSIKKPHTYQAPEYCSHPKVPALLWYRLLLLSAQVWFHTGFKLAT